MDTLLIRIRAEKAKILSTYPLRYEDEKLQLSLHPRILNALQKDTFPYLSELDGNRGKWVRQMFGMDVIIDEKTVEFEIQVVAKDPQKRLIAEVTRCVELLHSCRVLKGDTRDMHTLAALLMTYEKSNGLDKIYGFR